SPLRRPRGLRPAPESLESRRLLSKTISGVDGDGDQWTLQLIGPGDLRVTKQDDANGNPQDLTTPSQIKKIKSAGADPTRSRLVGKVTKSASGDGKVFFQKMTELGGAAESASTGNGILAIDIPNFWLGDTSPTGTPVVGTTIKGSIDIPDG